jgi:hypothetical protein
VLVLDENGGAGPRRSEGSGENRDRRRGRLHRIDPTLVYDRRRSKAAASK